MPTILMKDVFRDLNAWYPQIKKGGIFCGHDFLDGIIPAGNFGVKTAVEEFIKDKGIILLLQLGKKNGNRGIL